MTPTFETLVTQFETLAGQLQSAYHRGATCFVDGRRKAYAMAVNYRSLVNHYQGRLVEYLTANGITGKNRIDQWIERMFAPMQLGGDSPYDVIKAVHEGMSEKEYLATTASDFLAARRASRKQAVPSAIRRSVPHAPSESLPAEERAERWKKIAELALFNERQTSRELRVLRRQNDQLRRRIAAIERQQLSMVRRPKAAAAAVE